VQVLMQPRNALGKQFAYQFELSGTQLVLTPGAQRAVAGLARVKGTGARGLRSILEKVLLDAQYHVSVALTLYRLPNQQFHRT